MLGILDEEPTKFEKWLSKTLGKSIDKIVMATAIVLAVALSIGLFFMLPELFAKFLKGIWPDPGMGAAILGRIRASRLWRAAAIIQRWCYRP